jgi:hypothetical protein
LSTREGATADYIVVSKEVGSPFGCGPDGGCGEVRPRTAMLDLAINDDLLDWAMSSSRFRITGAISNWIRSEEKTKRG